MSCTAYGPGDSLTPVVMHYGDARKATLTVTVQNVVGEPIDKKVFSNITLPAGRQSVSLPAFKPAWKGEGYYRILYHID